jgi:hypothetical protein
MSLITYLLHIVAVVSLFHGHAVMTAVLGPIALQHHLDIHIGWSWLRHDTITLNHIFAVRRVLFQVCVDQFKEEDGWFVDLTRNSSLLT